MANVTIEMSSDEAKLHRGLQRVIAQQARMRSGFDRTGRSARTAGRQADQSFGTRARASLVSYAGGFVGITAAVGAATAAIRLMKAETDAAVESFAKLKSQDRALSQVAQNADDLRGLRKKSDRLSTTFGISREESRDLVFSGRSEKFDKYVPRIAEAIGANLIGGEEAATVAGQLPALFEGRIDPLQAVNATLSAAGGSRLRFKQISQGLPQAAEGAAQIDADPAEVIAAVAVLSSRFKKAEQTGDRIKALASKFALDDRLKGSGLTGGVQALAAMTEEGQREFLGESVELNSAFNTYVEELANIQQTTKETQSALDASGTSGSALSKGIATNLEVFGPEIERQKGLMAREIARENRFAAGGANRQAELNRGLSLVDEAGVGIVGKGFAQIESKVLDLVGFKGEKGDAEGGVARAAAVGAFITGDFNAMERIREANEEQKEAAREMKDAARTINKAAGQQLKAQARAAGNTAGARKQAASKSVAVE